MTYFKIFTYAKPWHNSKTIYFILFLPNSSSIGSGEQISAESTSSGVFSGEIKPESTKDIHE